MPSFTKYLVGLAFALGLACSTPSGQYQTSQYREDAVACGEAVEHARECCSDVVVPAGACEFRHLVPSECGGCSSAHGSPTTDDQWPVLSVTASDAILGASCEDLAANDGCAAVQAMFDADHRRRVEGNLDCY